MQNIPSEFDNTPKNNINITSFKMKGSPDLGQAVISFFGETHPGVDPGHGKNRSIRSPFSKGPFLQIGTLQQQAECKAVIKTYI